MGNPKDTDSTSNSSGGINLTGDQTNVGGDVVGRDEVTQVQGDQINNFVTRSGEARGNAEAGAAGQ